MIDPVAPDWNDFLANLRRGGTPERVYYFEHGIAENIQSSLAERYDLWHPLPGGDDERNLRRRLAVHRFLGHELFRIFPSNGRVKVPSREGGWVDESSGAVTNWTEFENFAWPDPREADLTVMEQIEAIQPANMRAFHVIDIWEVVRDLMGFEQVCFAMYENPDLVTAVFDKVGSFAVDIMDTLCDFETFGAVYLADDLGYKTGLMMSPQQIERFVMPWHRRIADVAHRHGKLFLFHCCGNMYELIDRYVEDFEIDAKHSFEDAILPVTEAKERYGDRLSLLGGMDVDFLARSDPDAIRQRTRDILEVCQPGGGYCFGSGNWVTSYIPVENYLIMLDEARRWPFD
ncbi:MAG: uroporphyrinogen decarboxylase family protein [Candidatus Brocadiia bacterium]